MCDCRCSECFAEPVCTDDDVPIGGSCEDLRQMIRVVRKHFADAGKMVRWISVEERLPEYGTDVLCWYEYYHWSKDKVLPEYGIGYYICGYWGGEVSNGRDCKVLYWMPLPEPPEVQS